MPDVLAPEPWKLIKTDLVRTATILNLAIQICANLSIAFEPFLPFMSEKLVKMLGLSKISWNMLGCFDLVPDGAEIAKPELLFEKIDDAVVEAQVKTYSQSATAKLAIWQKKSARMWQSPLMGLKIYSALTHFINHRPIGQIKHSLI